MKSKEEFIAGIYEKAANYAEEEKKTKAYAWKTAALRIAAAAVVCVSLAGISVAALWHGNGVKPPKGDDGIALLSETSGENGQPLDSVNRRMLPEPEEVTLTGTLESVDEKERVFWVFLESWGGVAEESRQEAAQGTLAAIRWDIPEGIPSGLSAGTELMAAGEAGIYGGAKSERYGMAQLTLTDMTKLWIWMEEENTYKNYNSEGQE